MYERGEDHNVRDGILCGGLFNDHVQTWWFSLEPPSRNDFTEMLVYSNDACHYGCGPAFRHGQGRFIKSCVLDMSMKQGRRTLRTDLNGTPSKRATVKVDSDSGYLETIEGSGSDTSICFKQLTVISTIS